MSEQYLDEVPIGELRLDASNPRLPRDLGDDERSQEALLRRFARQYNPLELARSIADKGFSPRHAEALLVVEEPEGSGTYVVVEGNRRLASLLLLTDSGRRGSAGVGGEWDDLAELASQRGHQLSLVPVIVYEERSEIDDYLGFRHITGPTAWRPEAKARFIAKLLRDGASIGEVVNRIGSNHRTVRRYAEAHAVYTQAGEQGIDTSEVELAFGVFYNALDTAGVRQFLGLPPSTTIDALPVDPVPPEHIGRLRDLIGLLFGDDEAALDPVIRESRELKKLGEVLADEAARAWLIQERDLERAWLQAGGGKLELLGALRDARLQIILANGQASEFKDDADVQDAVERVFAMAQDLIGRYGVEVE